MTPKPIKCAACGHPMVWLRPSACICPWCAEQRIKRLEYVLERQQRNRESERRTG